MKRRSLAWESAFRQALESRHMSTLLTWLLGFFREEPCYFDKVTNQPDETAAWVMDGDADVKWISNHCNIIKTITL